MTKIFPHSILRIAGISFDDLHILNSKELTISIHKIINVTKELDEIRTHLSNKIYSLIQTQENSKIQNLLLNFRRDIYNLRKSKSNISEHINQYLDFENINDYSIFINKLNELEKLKEDWDKEYQIAVYKERKILQGYSSNEVLLKGLIFSSPDLLDNLPSFRSAQVKEFKKNELNIEKSLLKYITRISAKTSPFSTFTNLDIINSYPIGDFIFRINVQNKESSNVRSHVRLNNLIFNHLKTLFFSYSPLYNNFLVRPNPTIKNKGEFYVFLTNFNNIESFQKLEFNNVLDFILAVIKENIKGLSFNVVLERLLEKVDAERKDLELYLQQLIKIGFLEYNLGISGVDPNWDLKLIQLLTPIKDKVKHIPELIITLEKIRSFARQVENSESSERVEILSQAYATLKKNYLSIEEEIQTLSTNNNIQENSSNVQQNNLAKNDWNKSFNFKVQKVFYEDTTKKIGLEINQRNIQQFINSVNELLHYLLPLSYHDIEYKRMVSYFRDKYQNNNEISFLTFYEDYYRDVKIKHEEYLNKILIKNKQTNTENVIKLDDENHTIKSNKDEIPPPYYRFKESIKVQELNKLWSEKLQKLLESIIINDDEVNITTNILEKIEKEIDIERKKLENQSMGAFIQFYQQDKQLKGFLNAIVPGYGKWMSRFLHVFPSEITNSLRDWNNETLETNLLNIENTDATCFNANLHPSLMPYEIQVPGGNNILEEEFQLKISDFNVHLANDTLSLIHIPTNKKCHVFDLGFQNITGRSKMYHLLSQFSKSFYMPFHTLNNTINQYIDNKSEVPDDEKKVYKYPRITFENNVIIQRRKWHFPKSTIPIRSNKMTDSEYYINIWNWLTKNGLPTEVFVIINPYKFSTNMNSELLKKLTSDDYKPQYINFESTIHVSYFEKMINKMPDFLIIEEMLPSSKDLLEVNQKKWVTENVIQWSV